jgi:hypothetical protein
MHDRELESLPDYEFYSPFSLLSLFQFVGHCCGLDSHTATQNLTLRRDYHTLVNMENLGPEGKF